jgi:TPR repeat protein
MSGRAVLYSYEIGRTNGLSTGKSQTVKLRHAISAIILVLCLAAPAAAESYNDALAADAAYDRGDYATALRLYRSLADEGYSGAQERLGTMYDIGLGVPGDYAEAVRWYRLAADKGHALAQHDLGNMYEQGHGVTQDYTEAVKWFRKAANQGLAVAQLDLGVMYNNGTGVPQDHVLAHMWYNLAAAQGVRILKAEQYRDRVAQRMSPAQIAEAQRLAREWKPQ